MSYRQKLCALKARATERLPKTAVGFLPTLRLVIDVIDVLLDEGSEDKHAQEKPVCTTAYLVAWKIADRYRDLLIRDGNTHRFNSLVREITAALEGTH